MENNIFPHINDDREFHLLWKGITDGPHSIIPESPRTHQRQGDLIISSQNLLSLKDIKFTSFQKRVPSNISEWCVEIFKNTLLKLDPHFASNRCQEAWFINA